MVGLIFIIVRACVHYALFEDEAYLDAQLGVLKQGIALFMAHGSVLEDDAAPGRLRERCGGSGDES